MSVAMLLKPEESRADVFESRIEGWAAGQFVKLRFTEPYRSFASPA